jgi:ATP-dependent RNA helicase
MLTINRCVIFVNSKKRVDILASQLNKNNFSVSSMHGDMDQDQREVIMKDFMNGLSRLLISTDLLVRVDCASLVINYELPKVIENYIHRFCLVSF